MQYDREGAKTDAKKSTEMNQQIEPRRYWFPAKRYGWGWGLPATWEGWVFLLVWLGILLPTILWLAGHAFYWVYPFLAVMIALLLAVCVAKGEPPRWRWGDKD
jgi:hypothetical protein